MEQVDFVSGGQRGLGNPYSSTYNQGWRNHPNFSWGQGSQQRAPSPPQQQAYQNASLPQKARNYTTEDVLARFMVSTEAKFETMQADLRTVQTDVRNLQASVKSIENQMGQLTSIVKTLAERLPGSLPSDTEVNPREHLKVITLRSGKELEERQRAQTEKAIDPQKHSISQDAIVEEVTPPPPPSHEEKTLAYKPRVPYPTRLNKDKDEAQFKKFANIFKQLHINIPLVEALSEMPKYAKFMKDLLTNKRKLEEMETVALTGNCSAVLQKKLPKKLSDPGSFILPCILGGGFQEKALADSGASINVMPYKLYLKLGLEDLRPTRMTLQLADRSIRKPRGVVEDVVVKVDKFVFPVDFVILDVDDEVEVPLILGRPFLNTSGALIDVKEGKMTLRVGEEEVIFKLPEAMKHTLDHDDSLYFTDETDMIISDCVQEVLALNPLDEYLEELDHKEDKGETHTPPTLKPSPTRKKTTPRKGKTQGKGQVASVKTVWSKVPEK